MLRRCVKNVVNTFEESTTASGAFTETSRLKSEIHR